MRCKPVFIIQDQVYLPQTKNVESAPANPSGLKASSRPLLREVTTPYRKPVKYMTCGTQWQGNLDAFQTEPLGGSVRSLEIDFCNLGITPHPEAFLFFMPDDSMSAWNLRRGDIAIVEPMLWKLKEGDLVLVAPNGMNVLRGVTYCKEVIYFVRDDGTNAEVLPSWDLPQYGVATALIRLFPHGEPIDAHRDSAADRLNRRNVYREYLQADVSGLRRNRLSDDPPLCTSKPHHGKKRRKSQTVLT